MYLRMRTAILGVVSFADNGVVLNNDTANERVGCYVPIA
jgi:hypothetical protein